MSSLRERIWSDMRVVEQVRFFFVFLSKVSKKIMINLTQQNKINELEDELRLARGLTYPTTTGHQSRMPNREIVQSAVHVQ